MIKAKDILNKHWYGASGLTSYDLALSAVEDALESRRSEIERLNRELGVEGGVNNRLALTLRDAQKQIEQLQARVMALEVKPLRSGPRTTNGGNFDNMPKDLKI